jgi:hypothetical protein
MPFNFDKYLLLTWSLLLSLQDTQSVLAAIALFGQLRAQPRKRFKLQNRPAEVINCQAATSENCGKLTSGSESRNVEVEGASGTKTYWADFVL